MDHREFSRLVAQRKVPSVLFFEGPEEHLKQEALQSLRKALLPEGLEDLNESRLTAPETGEIIAAAETLPFMADRRLILLRDYPAVTGRAEADDRLVSYLPSVPASSVLLFYCVLPVKQKKIRNAVLKLGGVVQFAQLKEQELTSFVIGAFRDLGRQCDARTADFLVFTCGKDTGLLINEIEKIAACHPENPAVLPEDVRALATPSTESKVFAMVDAVVAGQNSKAFIHLRNLLRSGERRSMILSMLLRQYRLMQQIKIMQYEKRSPQEISDVLGFTGFILQQYLRQAASYTGRQVREAVAICLNAELDVKSGMLREESALEAVMLKLLLLRENRKTPAPQK